MPLALIDLKFLTASSVWLLTVIYSGSSNASSLQYGGVFEGMVWSSQITLQTRSVVLILLIYQLIFHSRPISRLSTSREMRHSTCDTC